MDVARIAYQGYNGRRSRRSDSRSYGRSDRTYADKRAKFSEEFMSGTYLMRREREEREREAEEFSNTRGRGMSQRSERGVSQHSFAGSESISMDSPIGKYNEMKMLGYKFDEKMMKTKNMPEYILTPSPSPTKNDKYSCHQDSVSDEKSRELL